MGRMRSIRIETGIARVDRDGRHFFRVQLAGPRVGHRRLSKACATYEEAQAVKRAWLINGGAPLEEPAGSIEATLVDALREYVADLRARRKGHARAEQVVSWIRREHPDFAALPLNRVTPAHLFTYRHAREEAGRKANTIIRDLRVLRAALKKARPDLTVPSDVFPPENLTRVRVLQPEDEARVFALMDEPFRTMARLAALTLMRRADIVTLERDMLHLEQHLILLPKTKTLPRPVILGDEAVDLLRRQIATLPRVPPGTPYVFPSPRTGQPYIGHWVSRQWRRAARAVGLRSFTFHDLKHHAATVLLNNDASDALLMQAGGWSRPDQIRRYGAAVSGRMRALMNGLSKGLQYEHQLPPS